MNLKKIKTKLNSEAELVFKKLGMNCESFNNNIYSTCPVHEGSDNPRAFSFSPDKGIWKCWTRDCQSEYRNDIFGLIVGALSAQAGKNLEFKDALRWISSEFNISNYRDYSSPVASEDEDDFSTLIKNLKQSNKTIEDQEIANNYNAEKPSLYFNGRGFNKATLKYFDVGDCYDQGIMKERAIIPIHNDDGSLIVGLIGRSIKEYRQPKFLFSPSGFNKRYYFYNYHRAKQRAIETSCMYILEGQGDVWKMYEAGVKNAVSIFGKTISQEQSSKLMKLPITHLIVLTDNDQAGREARVKIQRDFSRMYKITFPRLSDKDIGDMTVQKIKKDILSNLKGTY
jgi:5S rRNA maturation endonuclease (ribonuclease M5)